MSFKLSKKSVEILQNLASISSKMTLVEGNKQASADKIANMYATATLPDTIDCRFGMYDMNILLSKFRLFGDDFQLSYDSDRASITIFDNYSKVVVPTSNLDRIPPPKIGVSIGEDPHDINFKLSSAMLSKMNEFAKVNGTDILAFTKPEDDNHIRIEGYVHDVLKENTLKGNETDPVWFLRVEESDTEAFRYFTMLNAKILDDDYMVKIRQFLGRRGDKNTEGLNAGRMPCIQFEGEYIRYVTNYIIMSENQKGLQNVK